MADIKLRDPDNDSVYLADNVELIFGSGADINDAAAGDLSMYWDGTNFVTLPTTDDSVWAWGNGTLNYDQKWFGSDANDFLYFDASASLLYTTDVDLQLKDNDMLVFGTGAGATGDVQIRWDGTDLDMLPTADDSVFKIGNGTLSFDTWIFGATANDYVEWDASASNLKLVGDSRIDFSSATVLAGNTDGGIFKAGTSGARVTEDTADMKFMAAYFDNGATSGDNRGFYLRLYLTGAGGGGEALRVFTDVEDVAGATAHGAHISLKFGTTGSITGQGIASRNTLHIPSAAMSGGTYAPLQAEIWSDGASSDAAGVTDLSFIRVVNGGNATGITNMDDDAALISYTGGSIASGNLVQTCNDTASSHGIRVKMNGTVMYLLANTTLA